MNSLRHRYWIDEGTRSEKSQSGFSGFDDPWKVMSPEDRKEANRLFKAAMKAFASSPRQEKLRAELEALLKKYNIGEETLSGSVPSMIGSFNKIIKPAVPATIVLDTPDGRRKKRLRRRLGKTSKMFSPDRMSRI